MTQSSYESRPDVEVSKASSDPTSGCKGDGSADRSHDRRIQLQRFLVMKAFNLRKRKQTLFQQFATLRKSTANQGERVWEYLDLDELCAYLSVPPFRRLILIEVFGLASGEKRIDFNQFVRFLQTGATQAAKEEKELQRSAANLPPPPRKTSSMEPSWDLVCFQPTWLSSQPKYLHPPPAPGLWKKREITIQERTTEYTKIDDQGRAQRLVEKERHQTEVIHMESLSGEFAHREITQFEQTEHLNDEMVHLDQGREEFLHLKSQHDEVSRFDSSTPSSGGFGGANRPDECEQQPPSPTIKRDPSAFGRENGDAEAAPGYEDTTRSAGAENQANDWNGEETAPEYEQGTETR